ncbi:MAG TPA: FAD-dependent oxidoreductase [Pseudolabrys sp.]|nr:FAD-dependent oxidoreductase [Pseudolabrys sp.]
MASAGTVIIGAGQGGYQVAASLREHGYGERIVIVGDEPVLPYQRPPLSKAYLLGEMTAERLLLRPQSYYEKHAIDLITGDRAATIDRAAARVELASGASLSYDHMVIATGARNRKLPVEGADLMGVLYLRTMAESDAIKEHFAAAQEIVVAGAGFIGLEIAAVASKLGKNVTVVEPLARVMSRAVTPSVSEFYAQAHAQWGVKLLLNTRLERIRGEGGRVVGVALSEGRELPADLVLVGIGIEPETALAQNAGLTVANGIVVDAQLRTADAKISAIGDCAAFPEAGSGRMIRLESVQNAADQGRCVAKRIVGEPADYAAVPWFWSDQRDLKLQMVGLTAGCDRTVLRGDPAGRAFSVFCFHGEKLIGIESINHAGDHMFGRRLLAAGESLTPEQAGDLGFDLKARLASLMPARERAPR